MMAMFKGMDWQMVGFVVVSLFQEYWLSVRIPQVHYYETNNQKAA